MSYLLDTHTILWFVNESPKLPLSTRELTEESTGIFTSIVSFWEMAIKDNLDKLSLPVDRLQHSFKRNDVPVSYVIFFTGPMLLWFIPTIRPTSASSVAKSPALLITKSLCFIRSPEGRKKPSRRRSSASSQPR